MKKIYMVVFLTFIFIFQLKAQDNCEDILKEAKEKINNKSPFLEQSSLVSLLEPCALSGNPKAENYLGLVYLNGLGVAKDTQKAFNYISSSADKGFANAQYNLGRFYKYGIGCHINFIQAVSWFEKSALNGNQRAAYSLGYMYYKGYGVEQDYKKAVSWFEKSDFAMAKHFLGICYYFGYGVTADESKAVEILSSNTILNSKTFLKYIKKEQKKKNETLVRKALNSVSTDSTHISSDIIKDIVITNVDETIELKSILGKWKGKLIQYDWSGKQIVRVIPITMNFSSKNNEVIVKTKINKKEYEFKSVLDSGSLYLEEDITFSLDKLYSHNPKLLFIDYSLLSINFKMKQLAGVKYLTGGLDTYINNRREFGHPMSIVLKPKGSSTNLDEEAIEAISAQKDQFIKLYPVPFNNQLKVQYQLDTASNVYVELYSINGINRIVIASETWKEAGDYSHTLSVESDLPKGLYVVKVVTGNKVYNRTVIKKD